MTPDKAQVFEEEIKPVLMKAARLCIDNGIPIHIVCCCPSAGDKPDVRQFVNLPDQMPYPVKIAQKVARDAELTARVALMMMCDQGGKATGRKGVH